MKWIVRELNDVVDENGTANGEVIKKNVSEKKEKTTNFKIVTTSGLGRMGGNWVLNGVLTCGALAQALLGQQLQHREAMTSCQEQRFEMEERPLECWYGMQ
jgi:hypothetical protein